MKYNPRPFERLLTRFIAEQYSKIEALIDKFARDVSISALMFSPSSDEDFFFKNYPALSRKVDGLLCGLWKQLTTNVSAAIEWSWDLANAKNDDMVRAVVASIGADRIPQGRMLLWTQRNLEALQAFEERRIAGLNISDRVWSFLKGVKGDLELALDLGIGEGASADRLSREVRGYLREPARLYRRVRDEKGILRLSKSASNYHPGQGVYRSSYKNAKRLAATETNMSYRTADNERMNQIDWILGYEVHLSKNHTCLDAHGVPQPFYDICDILQGRYPKWFKFVGWHPNCRCYVTTILPSQSEMIEYLAAMDEDGVSSYQLKGYVTDIPPQMKAWLRDNESRVLNAQSLPYWIKDNPRIAISEAMESRIDYEGLVGQLRTKERIALEASAHDAVRRASLVGDTLQGIAEGIAYDYEGAMVTPLNYKTYDSIARKANTEGCSPLDLKDTVRTTIVVGRENIEAVLDDLSLSPGFMRLKRQTPDKFYGYSGNIVNIQFANGIIGEIQVNTPEMIYAKNKPKSAKKILGEDLWNEIALRTGQEGGLGHVYYERFRELPERSAERIKYEDLSREYYSHFQ